MVLILDELKFEGDEVIGVNIVKVVLEVLLK